MSKIGNKSSREGWLNALKDYQFLLLAVVLVIGIYITVLKGTADDLKKHQLLKMEYIVNDQEYRIRQLDGVIDTQQIIIIRQRELIERMNSIINKLAPPEPIDPDKWT